MRTKLLGLCLLLASCQTVTVRPGGGDKTDRDPDFVARQHFFAWGLAPGAKFVNLKTACPSKPVEQLSAHNSFLDGLFGALTLGIYSPRTASVWCGQADKGA